MKIGLFAPLANPWATPEYLATLARGAVERGFHSLWVAEHVVLFDDYASQYPYAQDGRILVSICPYLLGQDPDFVKRYRATEIDQLIVMAFAGTPDDLLTQLDDLAKLTD